MFHPKEGPRNLIAGDRLVVYRHDEDHDLDLIAAHDASGYALHWGNSADADDKLITPATHFFITVQSVLNMHAKIVERGEDSVLGRYVIYELQSSLPAAG